MITDLLNQFGIARIEDDFAHRDDVSGDRHKRGDFQDFAAGWGSCAIRHNLQSYFTDEAKSQFSQ